MVKFLLLSECQSMMINDEIPSSISMSDEKENWNICVFSENEKCSKMNNFSKNVFSRSFKNKWQFKSDNFQSFVSFLLKNMKKYTYNE